MLLSWTNARDEAAVLLQILAHLRGVEGNAGVEVREGDNQHRQHDLIPEAVLEGLPSLLMPLVGKNAKIVAGNCRMAKPKISGITPVELIFIGM